ncbi:MAG: hypothetical protein DI535_27330 [Citrobacter freundii]|nr:MAG: hypothetical protein DI535_27330 [Citrobacter freundii]
MVDVGCWMVGGRWSMLDRRDGRWSMVDGRWSMVDGRWSMVDGRWSDCTRYTKKTMPNQRHRVS